MRNANIKCGVRVDKRKLKIKIELGPEDENAAFTEMDRMVCLWILDTINEGVEEKLKFLFEDKAVESLK